MRASPCIEVCQMAADNSVCVGCFRTLAEIAGWRDLTEAERTRVVFAARGRRTAWPGGEPPAAGARKD